MAEVKIKYTSLRDSGIQGASVPCDTQEEAESEVRKYLGQINGGRRKIVPVESRGDSL